MMHDLGLIGGTFDRLHSGHLALIEEALTRCRELEIWITSDEIAKSKDNSVNSWQLRSTELTQSLANESSRISLHVLEDDIGPSATHKSATAIFCTEETLQKCKQINIIRLSNNLDELEIHCVSRISAWDGEPISSSRIRLGSIDREGNPWIPESFRVPQSSLTPEVEAQLKDPFGQLFEGPEDNTSIATRSALSEIGEISGALIAVGDVTVLSLQKEGRSPDIALIDGLTKRKDWLPSAEIETSIFDNLLECSSPPGVLTEHLLDSCESSVNSWIKHRESSLITVDGEEDLAPLLLHPLAPIGSVVLYGQPGKGIVIRWTDEESKSRCRKLLMGFKAA